MDRDPALAQAAAARPRGWALHWARLERSLGRRWREWRLPRGYARLGTRYGGWWLDADAVRPDPLLIDGGLGKDISFDDAFLTRFGGLVLGVEANPESLAWCRERCLPGMKILDRAFWTRSGEMLTFCLPRPPAELPKGADGVSGSLLESHVYVAGGAVREVVTTCLSELLEEAGREECDVLKLDIEGAEYAVLEDLVARGLLRRCRQVLVEFHHGATAHTQADTAHTAAAVVGAGFQLVHVEGRNYSFRRSELG